MTMAARWGEGRVLARLRDLGRHYIRDLVFGANDGIITTFAVVSGVAGAELSNRIVLIMGFANLVADGLSMGASNFLGMRSEQALNEENQTSSDYLDPLQHGFATLLAFVVAGTVPLIAYLVPHRFGTPPFVDAIVLTTITSFVVGASRTLVYRRSWWRSGLEMLAVGVLAAASAYLVGRILTGG